MCKWQVREEVEGVDTIVITVSAVVLARVRELDGPHGLLPQPNSTLQLLVTALGL